jgi:hypothetical protein
LLIAIHITKRKKKNTAHSLYLHYHQKKYREVFEAAAKAFAQKGVKKVALLMSNYDDNDNDDVCRNNNNDNNKRQHPVAIAPPREQEEEEENNGSLFIKDTHLLCNWERKHL